MSGLFTTQDLIGVTRKVKALPKFFLTFFNREIAFESEEIAFDRVSTNYNQVAPFVAPVAQGRVMREEGFSRLAFKPAYLKPKNVVDPNMVLPVQPGESALRGTLSNAQKRAAVITHLVMKQDMSIDNRLEWMAAQAALYGYCDVEGEDYPKTRVDFGRDPALTITVDWRASNASRNPMDDLKDARFMVSDKSQSGAVVRDWVMGGDAWNLFWEAHKTEIIELMKIDIRGSTTEVTRVWDGLEGVEFMGSIAGVNGAGRINIWVNTQRYKDIDGQLKYLMPQNAVWGATDAIEGVRCFGAIMEAGIGYQAVSKYPKNWINQDPSVEYIMTQSAPLMVPVDPNSSVLLFVTP